MSGYLISARIIRRGIQVTKNSKAVSSKDSQNNRENFGVSCNNKSNWETLYEWRVYVVIHRSLSMEGNCKSEGHKGLGKASESVFRVLTCSRRSLVIRGSPGESDNEILMLDLAKLT